MTTRKQRILESIRSMAQKAQPLYLILMLTVLAQTTSAQQYQVTFLDDLGGNSRGNSINNKGWVAGFSLFAGIPRRHATLWRDGLIHDLGTLGAPERNSNVTWPVKNNKGIIAGISQTNTPEPNGERWSCAAFLGNQTGFTCLGFRWQKNVMTALLPLTGGNNSFATGANNTGVVVGWAENGVHDPTNCVAPQVLQFRPVTWGPDANQPQELPLFPGDSSGAATALNNRGQIVGISGICDQAVGRHTAKHALLWENGKITNLGNLGAELWITPMAINQQGVIVGFGATDESDLGGDFLKAFIWTRKGGMKQIDPLPIADHVLSQATGINEAGQVVGSSCTFEGACQGFLWQNGVLKNLNDPLVTPGFNGFIVNAQDINDDGEITGRAVNPATGRITAFVATPIIESANSNTASSSALQAKVVLPKQPRIRQRRGMGKANLLR